MLVWLTLPFYDFCGFRSVAVNIVYKLQFFYIYQNLRSRFGIERHAYTRAAWPNSVCMYVCMWHYSSQTTEPICIKIIPANRAFYADCYRLLRFEIFTKYDEYCPKERTAVALAYFANGNVSRDVIVVISVTIDVFRNNPDWPTKKKQKTPDSQEINFNTIANLNKFKLYTCTVLRSVLVNFSAVSGFQFINVQCPSSWMSF